MPKRIVFGHLLLCVVMGCAATGAKSSGTPMARRERPRPSLRRRGRHAAIELNPSSASRESLSFAGWRNRDCAISCAEQDRSLPGSHAFGCLRDRVVSDVV